MRVVWSRRTTTCTKCHEDIVAKVQRLDDTIRRKGKIITLHYHPSCYFEYVKGWPANNPYTPLTSNGGRPLSNLTSEKRKRRQQLLSNMSALMRYYLPSEGPLRLNVDGNISNLTERDLRQFKRFNVRKDKILDELRDMGGIPDRYAGMVTSPEEDAI